MIWIGVEKFTYQRNLLHLILLLFFWFCYTDIHNYITEYPNK